MTRATPAHLAAHLAAVLAAVLAPAAASATPNTWIVAVQSSDGTYWERDATEPGLLSTATSLTRDTLFILSEEADGTYRLRYGSNYVCDSYLGAGGPLESCPASASYSSFELLGSDNIFEDAVGIRVAGSAFPRHYRLDAADHQVVTGADGDDRPQDLFRIVKAHAEIELGGGERTVSADGRTVHFTGEAIIPSAAYEVMVLPELDVTVTYNSEGRMSSLQGTGTVPMFPDHRFLNSLPIELPNIARLSVGWDFPENFNHNGIELPIDQGRRYMYLNGTVGGEGSIAGMDLPAYQEILIVFDHVTGSVFGYGPLMMFGDYAVGYFGITSGGTLSWEPGRDDLFLPENRAINLHDAHIWARGENGVFVSDNFGFGIQGEAAMTVHQNRLAATGLTTTSVRKLGAKGHVGIALPLAGEDLDFTFADATLFYQHDYSADWAGGRHWMTFAGELDTHSDVVLPYGVVLPVDTLGDAELYARGYVDTDFHDNDEAFLDVDVTLHSFGGARGVVVEGLFHADEHSVDFAGSADFGHQRVALSGHADSHGAIVAGELSYSFDVRVGGEQVGRIRAELDVEVAMTAQPGVAIDARAQFCAAGSCDSVGASASLEADGAIKVCANIPLPDVGSRCTRID